MGMATDGVSGNTNSTSSQVITNAASALDRDAFLNLLMTQIQYQDPMKPMDDTQFISQLAQYSSLEQMQQVNDKMGVMLSGARLGDTATMIGHTVTVQNPETGEEMSGKVTGVKFENNTPYLVINNQSVDAGWVTSIDN